MDSNRTISFAFVPLAALLVGCGSTPQSGSEESGSVGQAVSGSPELYAPIPNRGAIQQMADLKGSGDKPGADLIRVMINTAQAVWFTGGTPKRVQQDVLTVMARARNQGTPVLVAYNLPYRDCSQYSAGGALGTAAYQAWIDGFAAGIGDDKAVVVLEPDGLGIIPWYTKLDGNLEWCQPPEADRNTAASDRFEQLKYAVSSIRSQAPHALVYLDATHSSWLAAAEAGSRLVKAGVDQASGFFLNVSNYQFTHNSVLYGMWVSRCIASAPNFDDNHCAQIWWNGGPATGWQGTAMSPYGEWSNGAADLALNTAGIESRYTMVNGPEPSTHFVIDTSRNGVGPWRPPDPHDGDEANDGQDWCNPPDRGVGPRPTTLGTASPLVDAYLWVKIPGESDGQCTRWADPGTGLDPVRGMADPAAGAWFPQMALELARNANPAL